MKVTFDAQAVPWPGTPEGQAARRYLTPLMERGAPVFVQNVHARVGVVCDGTMVLPFTVDPAPRDSYVASPVVHLAHYPSEELHKLHSPLLSAAGRPLLATLAAGLGVLGAERMVLVNNWLLSTNLYPALTPAQLQGATAALVEAFPDRAVAWKSLDFGPNEAVAGVLERLGHERLLSRLVTYIDPRPDAFWQLAQVRKDLKRTRRDGVEVVDGAGFTDADLVRALALYQALYLDRYSRFNPQFTLAFLHAARDDGLLHLRGLKEGGVLMAVRGTVRRAGMVTAPLCGHDLNCDNRDGWYRRLAVQGWRDARDAGLLLHASAGVGSFKRGRGGVSVPEYSLVFTAHLPRPRRLVWTGFMRAVDRHVRPLLIRHDV